MNDIERKRLTTILCVEKFFPRWLHHSYIRRINDIYLSNYKLKYVPARRLIKYVPAHWLIKYVPAGYFIKYEPACYLLYEYKRCAGSLVKELIDMREIDEWRKIINLP